MTVKVAVRIFGSCGSYFGGIYAAIYQRIYGKGTAGRYDF